MKPAHVIIAIAAHPMTIAIASLPLVATLERRREVTSRLGIALPLGWAVSKAIKHAFPRQKPRLLSLTPRQSLPSGHSVATTTLALTLVDAYRAWRAAPLAAAAIGLVGSSRVRAREHRPSEVLIGIAIGVVASVLAGLAARCAQRRGDQRVSHAGVQLRARRDVRVSTSSLS